MSPEMQTLIRLESIFMPHARARRDALYQNGQNEHAKFVHYTSAEAALKIIQSKRIWMRNVKCMSDYREVNHGLDLLNSFFRDENCVARFNAALDTCASGIGQEAIALFNRGWNNIQFDTYIASISEHGDEEDRHGRLSMWRAFGGSSARVAIVFNIPWYTGASTELKVILSPVAYHDKEKVHDELNAVIANIEKERDFLSRIDRSILLTWIFHMLVSGVTCLKHEGFKEECEWRVIYSPTRALSSLMRPSTEVIGGIPQVVYNLPLDGIVSPALAGLDFANIFDRLIIGPSQYPTAQYEAFVGVLKEVGIQDAAERVFVSDIPIRT